MAIEELEKREDFKNAVIEYVEACSKYGFDVDYIETAICDIVHDATDGSIVLSR